MNVLPVSEAGLSKYYGYATGPGGFLKSDDGLHWEGMPQPEVDWDTVPAPAAWTPPWDSVVELEIGGCEKFGANYYLVGGLFNITSPGYEVYTFRSGTPIGPFRADAAAFRLCGNSLRWVEQWARFCRRSADEVLVNGYMYSGYSYETGECWLQPIKKAKVDRNDHLYLAYWEGNEALKGSPIEVDLNRCETICGDPSETECGFDIECGRLEINARPECGLTFVNHVPKAVVVVDSYDFDAGIVVEGTIHATSSNRRLVSPTAGFYLEEKAGEGTAILLHGYGQTEIGKAIVANDAFTFHAEDTIGRGCAVPAGIVAREDHSFRLLAHRNMFELYLDDRYVQTFNTTHDPDAPGLIPLRLGFIAQNGRVLIENLKIWKMSLT
jgi:hypothetical protein